MTNRLIEIFENANKRLLENDYDLFKSKVSERTLCGALMIHLYNEIQKSEYNGYKVDVEYNRNKNGKVKTVIKSILGPRNVEIKINCDLIVHSRGTIIEQDNLIAIEMKKSSRKQTEKESDRNRLVALTKDSYDGVWSFDGKVLPDHVCRYQLGIYYEINYSRNIIKIEYYRKGENFDQQDIHF